MHPGRGERTGFLKGEWTGNEVDGRRTEDACLTAPRLPACWVLPPRLSAFRTGWVFCEVTVISSTPLHFPPPSAENPKLFQIQRTEGPPNIKSDFPCTHILLPSYNHHTHPLTSVLVIPSLFLTSTHRIYIIPQNSIEDSPTCDACRGGGNFFYFLFLVLTRDLPRRARVVTWSILLLLVLPPGHNPHPLLNPHCLACISSEYLLLDQRRAGGSGRVS